MNRGALAVGGGLAGVALIGFLVSQGRQTTQGVTFAAPDPSSVAAVESSAATEINSLNQANTERMKIVADTLATLGGQQTQLALGTLAEQQAVHQTDATTQQVALQVSGQEYSANTSMQSAIATANANAQAAEASVAAQTTMAQIYAGVQNAQANAAEQISLDQANAQRTASKNSMWGSIIGSVGSTIGKVFGL